MHFLITSFVAEDPFEGISALIIEGEDLEYALYNYLMTCPKDETFGKDICGLHLTEVWALSMSTYPSKKCYDKLQKITLGQVSLTKLANKIYECINHMLIDEGYLVMHIFEVEDNKVVRELTEV